jgi:hypothetical protein
MSESTTTSHNPVTQPQEDEKIVELPIDAETASENSFGKGDLLSLEHTDPVINAKMHLVNNVRKLVLSLLIILNHNM